MPSRPSSLLRRVCPLLALSCLLVGCHVGSGPSSASFASVKITSDSPAKIQEVTTQVFQADGYTGGAIGPTKMTFEKEASRVTSISRSGVVATHEGARTLERVRAELVYLGGGSYRLQCQAYTVSNAGDSFFEDEVRMTNLRSGPYQSLLDQVAKQFK